MSINISLADHGDLKPKLCVFGVGGAGGNAINNMIEAGLSGVEFCVANTDAQTLEYSLVPKEKRIQLGVGSTQGLGAGSYPEVGAKAAEESLADIVNALDKFNMVFITAGMGGGTGTGAGPVIARAARELGILTVGVVTKPFYFEGRRRMLTAEKGIQQMYEFCDTLIIVPNQNLFRTANQDTAFNTAFNMVDNVLLQAVRAVSDLITMPGLVNLDFADIKAIMGETGGKAMMGTGEAEGEDRARKAAEEAIFNPLLASCSVCGAAGVIINITGGKDMTLFEVEAVVERIREAIIPEGTALDSDDPSLYANIIFGSAFNPELQNKIKVSVIATGIENAPQKTVEQQQRFAPKLYNSDQNQDMKSDELEKHTTTNENKNNKNVGITSVLEELSKANTDIQPNQASEQSPKPFFVPPRPQEVKDQFQHNHFAFHETTAKTQDTRNPTVFNKAINQASTGTVFGSSSIQAHTEHQHVSPYQNAMQSLTEEDGNDDAGTGSLSTKTSTAISNASAAIGALNATNQSLNLNNRNIDSDNYDAQHNQRKQQKHYEEGLGQHHTNAHVQGYSHNRSHNQSESQKKQSSGVMKKVTETLKWISGGKSGISGAEVSNDEVIINMPTYIRKKSNNGEK